MPDTQWSRYQVFLQEKPGTPHQDMGSIHAPDREMALLNARDVFVRRPACVSLWIVPVQSIFSRTAQEIQENGLATDHYRGFTCGKRDTIMFLANRNPLVPKPTWEQSKQPVHRRPSEQQSRPFPWTSLCSPGGLSRPGRWSQVTRRMSIAFLSLPWINPSAFQPISTRYRQ